jgi:IrrE N-terminal-like domain
VRRREYNKAQEEEAYGVGAAALLPWEVFFRAIDSGRTIDQLAETHNLSEQLIQYRIQITGAYKLYQARQRFLR